MNKPKPCKLCVFLCVFAAALLLFALMFAAVGLSTGAKAYFAGVYDTLGNARAMGMSQADLTEATWRMVEYMKGREESIDLTVTVHGQEVSMFNEQERVHMADVRHLYLGLQTAAIIAAVLAILLMGLALLRRRYWEWGLGVLWGSGVFLAVLLVLGAWVFFDFSSFWTAFHHVFFTNDLWLFDPATSRMINMMPLPLFYGIVTRAGLMFLSFFAAFALTGALGVRLGRRSAGRKGSKQP